MSGPGPAQAEASLRLERFGAAESFLVAAGPFLERHEAENNLILGLAATLRDHPQVYPQPPLLALVRDQSGVCLAALRTPPFGLVLSAGPPAAVEVLAAGLAMAREALPGVAGPTATADHFARRWRAQTRVAITLEEETEIMQLTGLAQVPNAPGRVRLADTADAALLGDWLGAFARERGLSTDPARLAANVERWTAARDRAMYFWMLGNHPVSLAGVGGATPHGIKIGPVYTPPAWRGRGYASALVATVCAAELVSRSFCCLFVDQGNAIARQLYLRLGFTPVCQIHGYRLESAG